MARSFPDHLHLRDGLPHLLHQDLAKIDQLGTQNLLDDLSGPLAVLLLLILGQLRVRNHQRVPLPDSFTREVLLRIEIFCPLHPLFVLHRGELFEQSPVLGGSLGNAHRCRRSLASLRLILSASAYSLTIDCLMSSRPERISSSFPASSDWRNRMAASYRPVSLPSNKVE